MMLTCGAIPPSVTVLTLMLDIFLSVSWTNNDFKYIFIEQMTVFEMGDVIFTIYVVVLFESIVLHFNID